MGRLKYSKRIDITIPLELFEQLKAQAERYHTSRSGIIRWAFQEWMEAHPNPAQLAEKTNIDKEKPFNHYLKPGMRPEAILDKLEEYEAARKFRL